MIGNVMIGNVMILVGASFVSLGVGWMLMYDYPITEPPEICTRVSSWVSPMILGGAYIMLIGLGLHVLCV